MLVWYCHPTALVDVALGPGAHHANVEDPRVAVLADLDVAAPWAAPSCGCSTLGSTVAEVPLTIQALVPTMPIANGTCVPMVEWCTCTYRYSIECTYVRWYTMYCQYAIAPWYS
jgi:hypothetical protein